MDGGSGGGRVCTVTGDRHVGEGRVSVLASSPSLSD